MNASKHLLICPLNWGLGHAVRCIPIIQTLLNKGQRVTIASDGAALDFLRIEFPLLSFVELPSYNIRYKTSNMLLNIAPQVPKLLRAIQAEKKILEQLIISQHYDAIISDNRYGIYTPTIPSIFMTHQLNIAVPNRLIQAWVGRRNRNYIRRYRECWVPDYAQEPSLAGQLSHQAPCPNCYYLGPLSSMQLSKQSKKYDIIAVLSGLEPQRSYFEKKIIEQALLLPHKKILLVAGQTASRQTRKIGDNIHWHSFMDRAALNRAILQAEVYIGRSGYTSLMDIVQLERKQVILVPTPGQTEQEYLAARFAHQYSYVVQQQQQFDLKQALSDFPVSQQNTYKNPDQSSLAIFIDKFLERLQQWV